MLCDDVCDYLAGQSLGLAFGSSTGNLFKVPIPEGAPDASVSVVEITGRPAVRAMGTAVSAPVHEVVRFAVTTRNSLNNYETARTLAQNIHNKLDMYAGTPSTGSNTRYLKIMALQPPFYIGEDVAARHRFVFNCEAWKERG